MSSVAAAVYERFHYVFTEKLLPHKPEFQIMVAPIICYWVVAIFYDILDRLKLPATERYRIVRKRTGSTNRMSMTAVVQRVLLQHAMQFTMAVTMFLLDPHTCDLNPRGGVVKSIWQVCLAMFLMDTWQYFIHRLVHVSPYLYKHVHSTHHKLYVPYAYGALYNHPAEAVLLDSLGGVVSQYASGISCDLVVYFFCFATVKTVLDHSGYRFPVNPLHDAFPNSAAFHDVHHDIRGIKRNFSQPFFTHWDRLLGTYLDPATFHLPGAEVAAGVDARLREQAADARTSKGVAAPAVSGEEGAAAEGALSSDESPAADSGAVSDAGSEDGGAGREGKKAQ